MDHNSLFFYLLGLVNWRIRTLRLPRELINKSGRQIRIVIGEPITVQQQDLIKDLDEFSRMLRSSVYDIPVPAPSAFTKRSSLTLPR